MPREEAALPKGDPGMLIPKRDNGVCCVVLKRRVPALAGQWDLHCWAGIPACFTSLLAGSWPAAQRALQPWMFVQGIFTQVCGHRARLGLVGQGMPQPPLHLPPVPPAWLAGGL